jgi:hypothetical protein
MKRKKIYLFLILLVVLIAGCGRPVQVVVPTVDSSARETALAGTALAVFGTATSTHAPTETPVPTTVISSQGTSLEIQEDQTTLFTDHKTGIQATFPAGWLVLRVGEPEFYGAFENEATKSPVFLNIFATMQDSDPAQFRVSAIDIREEVTYENFSKMEVVFAPKDQRTLNQVRALQAQKYSILKDYKLLSSRLTKTPSGLDIAVVEFQWQAVTPEKDTFMQYHKEVIFKVPDGTLALQLFTGLDQKDLMLPVFDDVFASLVLLTP